ncbi:cupin-like domain-containing protein [Sphingobium sp. BYY-5]|uniref:cupin-like domain-containing protein n=1 Tax=Sphingobium sp. BYY-5 TaxID=2926400 RepID=UPI001FA7B358|nr:cupin-like domain-containing protein [Sphingobium sp. BYY-5]MCI4591692.1 cupin-like domain-containing protein [Sphingobium sp. BYY-5]
MPRQTRRIAATQLADGWLADLLADQRPAIITGFVENWPLVLAGRQSAQAAMEQLLSHYGGAPVTGYVGAQEAGGRFFYDDALTGFNFERSRAPLPHYLDMIRADRTGTGPAVYVGSTDVDQYFPGLRAHNDLPSLFGDAVPTISLWIGNRTVAATHYDSSRNLACCLVGRRRFTLFPPDQVGNLYPGPLDPTPGGQVVSMVNPAAPDLDRYPRFATAMEACEVADLEPGDILFYPALWWHQVEALDGFNIMMNYWWDSVPDFVDTPMATLFHGLLSLRSRPKAERAAWRALFDHYLFGPPEQARDHLPEHAQGPLAPLDPAGARRLRAIVMQRLNR